MPKKISLLNFGLTLHNFVGLYSLKSVLATSLMIIAGLIFVVYHTNIGGACVRDAVFQGARGEQSPSASPLAAQKLALLLLLHSSQ